MKLKPKDIKPLREQLLLEQGHRCALCHEHLPKEQAVLDHRHSDGLIRSVLHRGCNSFIGHIENNQKRNLITENRLTMILANYSKYVSTTKTLVHPTYLTPEERIERNKRRAKKRRAKK